MATLAHQACGVVQHTNPHVAWLSPPTNTAALLVAFVFHPQPLVLLLKCGGKVVAAAAAVVAELDRMADKAAHTVGLLALPAVITGSCVPVFAIAIALLAPFVAAQWDNILEFASATAA